MINSYIGSFGSTPYFIKRKEGNIMIDVPRFNTKLANTIELEGGVQKIIVTHSGTILRIHIYTFRYICIHVYKRRGAENHNLLRYYIYICKYISVFM
jgi:hypothetical protein